MAKNYTRSKATKQLIDKNWFQLFNLFNIPEGSFKQMHDQAYSIFVKVLRAFAVMPQSAFKEAGNLKNAIQAAYTFAMC